jgi:3-methyladenine DNA glycosylase AlkD
MRKLADKIKQELQEASRPCPKNERDFVQRYLGSKRKFLNVKSADRDQILRSIVKEFKQLPAGQIVEFLDELLLSDTFEYVNFAGKLLAKSPEARTAINFKLLEKWLQPTTGWAECDSLCQSLFSEKEVLARWTEWQKAVIKFSNNKNIQLRRASLVLQVKPARESNNQLSRKLAYDTVGKLKGEKEVLITKAVSWLLRALSQQNSKEVRQY